MKKERSLKFKIPIYNCEVVFVVADNFIETTRSLLKEELRLDVNENAGIAFKHLGDCKKYVIMVKKKYENRWDIITHESLHITNYILNDRGIECSMANDEAQAYLLGYIIKNIQSLKEKKSTE